MKKIAVLFLIVLISISCQNKPTKQDQLVEKTTIENNKIENNQASENSESAKKWLIETIKTYFKKDFPKMTGITTTTYEEYKTEATNVDLDTDVAMTQTEFENKWKNKYDTKYSGIGFGFLISGQDWGKIEITKCNLLSESDDSYIFQTILSDTEFKTDYKRDIKIIKSGNSFLIDDVKEYN
ncbi:hypothetical protein L1S34_14800 [Flavobacterium sp. K77]|uniref:hypothetical protein n=1 Tax=Flavobacterium sp. K77 TaxID=2910676 RepID=UPI001F27A6F4|nr:hypothetical protein [Flavobacterium sp. K77]MCF6142559.1 hypothetical protein [Flavobacterium sp. K77]